MAPHPLHKPQSADQVSLAFHAKSQSFNPGRTQDLGHGKKLTRSLKILSNSSRLDNGCCHFVSCVQDLEEFVKILKDLVLVARTCAKILDKKFDPGYICRLFVL